jgi:8-oxo-dGTP pyrophosphatase MutT (NUDIX family)
MMDYSGYLEKIRACNTYTTENKIPFMIEGKRVGQIRDAYLDFFLQSDLFVLREHKLHLKDRYDTFEKRTEALTKLAKEALKAGITNRFMNEPYGVRSAPTAEPVALADRSISSLLGLISFGQHLNGFVRTKEGLKMWIGLRSRTKGYFAGKLDHLVAGGLPYGIDLRENLRKECYEEAGIAAEVADQAICTGLVSYRYDYRLGSNEDILYCYDLELDEDFVPRCTDGEVERFYLMDIEEVARIVRETDDFKLNCNLVIIDFLVRHGYLEAGQKGYFKVVTGLIGYK